ncbi:O-antigen polymerase [Streptococcus massiliensis]|nr:O-antigen polymerase [Streptococcus massiliensis]
MLIFRIRFMEPAGLFAVLWIGFVLGSVLFLHNRFYFPYSGVIWLLLVVCLFLLVAVAFPKHKKENIEPISLPTIPWFLLLLIILLGFFSVFYNMKNKGVGVDIFTNFSALQSVSHNAAVSRYSGGEAENSIISQILNTFIYLPALCSGYSVVYASRKKEQLICYLSFFPALFSMLLTSAKLAVVSFILLFFIGWYISYIVRYKSLPIIGLKKIISSAFITAFLYALFYFSFILRIGKTSENLFQVITNKLSIYAFGHIQGFDIWFQQFGWNWSDYGFGSQTFLAISSRLGWSEKKQGVYDLISGSSTNVYTQFRPLIEDYGAIFSLVIFIILGIFTYYLFNLLLRTSSVNLFAQVFLAALYYYYYYFITSPWIYSTYFLVFILFYVYLYISYQVRFIYKRR